MNGRQLVLCAAMLALVGCDDEDSNTGPEAFQPTPPTAAVNAFVESQSLPLFRYTHQVLIRDDVECFYSVFGEPQDCPSGCFYSYGFGLRYGDHLGWLNFDFANGYEAAPSSYFDVLSSDTALFDVDTWFVISDTNWAMAWQSVVPALARDEDTGRSALLSIAGILYTHHSLSMALDLVNNPAVAADVEILTLLSELPVVGVGDMDLYDEPRNRALELLGGLVVGGGNGTTGI